MCSKRNHQQRKKDKVWNGKDTIFVNHIFDKILIFKIHTEFTQFNRQKEKKIKNGENHE